MLNFLGIRCELNEKPGGLSVAVLLSGGVDSSLALRLLVAAGHRCKAFYLQIWFQASIATTYIPLIYLYEDVL
jgi:NH3-dependent NAD+ synthetase